MKKLLVLAAGILQVPIIKRAREMGNYVIAADGNPNAVIKVKMMVRCHLVTQKNNDLDYPRNKNYYF